MPSLHGVDLYLWNFAVSLMLCLRLLDKADSDLFCSMRRSYHCLHHVLPSLRTIDNVVTFITCLSVVPMFTKNHLLSVSVWFHITFTGCWFDSVSTSRCFRSSLVLCVILLLIGMSCHCPVCVRLSHSIKRLLT